MIRIRRLHRLRRRHWLAAIVGSLAASFLTAWLLEGELVNFVWRNSRGTWLEPHVVAYTIRRTDDPFYQALSSGRYRPGDPVEELTRDYPPTKTTVCEPYTVHTFGGGFEGVTVISKDGKLRSASVWSCTFSHRFFSDLSPAEYAEVDALYNTAREERIRRHDDAVLGVTGFGAVPETWDFYKHRSLQVNIPEEPDTSAP